MKKPLHTKTPGTALPGRWILTERRDDGWHIILLENDEPHLLRIIPYGSRAYAGNHASIFAEYYQAQLAGVWE